jgi:hypothetical protein
MPYNNNYNGNGGYRRNNYNNSYNNGGYNQGQNRPKKKRSGAKFGYSNGNAATPFVRGWKATRRFGLITYLCVPYKITRTHTSGSGKEWENWMLKIQFADGKTELKSCLYNVQSKKVIINDLGMVINPNAPNGGYCGSFVKRNR